MVSVIIGIIWVIGIPITLGYMYGSEDTEKQGNNDSTGPYILIALIWPLALLFGFLGNLGEKIGKRSLAHKREKLLEEERTKKAIALLEKEIGI